MREQKNIWPKSITVDKRIVQILSGSTYANFPSAIRELIINSYDADAENVWVDIDLKKKIITVRDDGRGMNEDDFAFYLRIAGKNRKKEEQISKGKRKIVGQFGVGFLSVLPFCEKYLIETKKKGTDEIVNATISSTEYFRNDFSSVDVEKIPINGGITKDSKLYNEQFTRIRLVGFSKLTESFFKKEYALKTKRHTIKNLPPLALLKWDLCEYLPLKYEQVNNVDNVGKQLNDLFNTFYDLPFSVHLNNLPLFRNIHANNILEISKNEEKIGNIKFKYVILSDYKTIDPADARYLLLRNLNVGVGERTTFDLGMDGKLYGKLAHLTGEVSIMDGLNELISVSRDKFNFSPDYEQLKDFLRQRLSKWANELDSINVKERSITEFTNKEKVSSLKDLRKGKIAQDITALKNKGYSIRYSEDVVNNKTRINKASKEVTLPKNITSYGKEITILDKRYRLVLDQWNFENSDNPALRFEKGKTIVNESYPLFQNKSTFDTFLKIQILFFEYLQDRKISKQTYQSLLRDFLKIFNK